MKNLPSHAPLRRAPRARRTFLFLLPFAIITAAGTSGGESGDWTRSLRNGPGDINHPVGVVPSEKVRIPEGWPLDAGGTITCRTCHEGIPSLARGAAVNLRGQERGAAFCAHCHEGNASLGHWQAMDRAHVRASMSATVSSGVGLDIESRRCMSCHDGVSAPDSTGIMGHRVGGYPGDRDSNHPVGIAYSRSKGRPGTTRMRPAGLLPKEVRLPGGAVSCVSCHNLYSSDPAKLTVPIEGSKLCLSCHDMD